MAEEKEQSFFELDVSFPKATKKARDKDIIFNKILTLIEENKETMSIKVKSSKRMRNIFLDSDEFMFAVLIGKRGKTIRVRLIIHDPERNIGTTNEAGNKLVTYMNTILGEGAMGFHVFSQKITYYPKKTTDLCRKLIGESQIAKINEEVKQMLNPMGIFFTYEMNDRKFILASFSNERSAGVLLSRITYKSEIPFDLLRIEYDVLSHPAKILKKLSEWEL